MAIVKPPAGARIDWAAPLARGLSSCWNLGEGVGVPRDSASGQAGTPVGAPTWVGSPYGPALGFVAASSQYVTLPTARVFNNNAPASVVAWFRTTSTTLNLTVYGEGNSGNTFPLVALQVNSPAAGNFRVTLRDSPGTSSNVNYTATAVNDGKWHHIAVVSTGAGGTNTLYLDGVAAGSVSNTSSTTLPEDLATIGALNRSGGVAQFFDGAIGAVRPWSRALTAAEVAADFAAPAGPFALRPVRRLFVPPAAVATHYLTLLGCGS